MDIESLTLKQIKEITSVVGPKTLQPKMPLTVGENYFIRTVTNYYTGHLKSITGRWLTLDNASWIADTGRFHEFLRDGKCNEYESFVDDVHVPIGSVVDITPWKHSLFKGNK